jgi:asparagine synthase (glutamine-hydrolysing)
MSGIAGIWNLDGQPVDLALLQQMAEAAAHRGPDGIRTWIAGEVALAHLALNTTPESWRERQPCSNRDNTCWITADARIDNRDELIRTFTSRGIHLENPTDVDLILVAYDLWGEECPKYLLGDFAFVVWDHPRQRLMAARDRFGIRPLFYHYNPGRRLFVFASEIKQLLLHPAVPRMLNEAVLGDFLISGYATNLEETAYRDIFRIQPAHTVTIDLTGLRKRRYWSLEDVRSIHYRTEEQYVEHFRGVFRQAVHCRMRSDRPFGIMMSGGVDSTAIASVAAGLLQAGATDAGQFETFSLVYDEIKACDERPNIEAVAAQYGLRTNYILADECWPLADYPGCFVGHDEPCPAVQYLLWDTALDAVRATGCRIVLTGYGGDDVCIESRLAYFNHLRQFRLIRFGSDVWYYWKLRRALPRLYLKTSMFSVLPEAVRRRLRPNAWGLTPAWLDPGLARRLNPRHRQSAGLGLRHTRIARAQGLTSLTGPEVQAWLAFLDQVVNLHSLEGRHPFFDARVVELMFSIPLELFFNPAGEKKPLLRQAVRQVLPEQVRAARPRVRADPLVYRGLRERGAETVRRLFSDPALARLGFINAEEFRQAYDRFQRGELVDSWVIWYSLAAEIWVNRLT